MFDEVWTFPMMHLVPRYGVSSGALARICIRHEIPIPPFGSWQRVQHGRRLGRPRLPAASRPELEIVRIDGQWAEQRARREHLRDDPEVASLLDRDAAAAPFKTRATLRGIHPFLRRASMWSIGSAYLRFVDTPCAHRGLRVQVSKAHFRRAILVLDALLAGLAARGFTVDTRTSANGTTLVVSVLGIDFRVLLREHLRPILRPSTDYERRRLGQLWRPGRLVGHGELELHFQIARGHVRRRWRDTPTRTLDALLAEIPRALIEFAVAERARRGGPAERRANQDR
jgi:hypothetical protein